MLASLCTLLLAVPQAAPTPPAPRVTTDQRGWPVLQPAGTASARAPGAEPASDFPPAPAAPPGAAAAGEVAEQARPHPSGASALDGVFARIGTPAAFASLACTVARLRIHVFDHRGKEIATRNVFHEADVRLAERDRLVFADERRTFGRDGPAVWAEQHGMLWPALEAQARGELELLGTLLRLPWVFADDQRWIVYPPRAEMLEGQPYHSVRAERRSDDARVGPAPGPAAVDSFDLYCEPQTKKPRIVRYRLARGAGERRVELHGQQPFGGVRIPTRYLFRRADASTALEIEVVRIDGEQRLPREQFQPPVR
jgi:hypothetical protein